MKKILIITALLILTALAGCAIYYIPILKNINKEKTLNLIKENNSVFISKIIEESSKNKDSQPSDIAKKIADELNSTQENPYDNSKVFYVLNNECSACTKVESDNELKMVIITTFDKNGLLVARTVIKPPSFVTYYKNDKD